jgi:hypothetical protein
MKRLAPAMFLLAALLLAGGATAQSPPDVTLGVDVDTVGLGDTVRVEMSATSNDSMPSDPQIGATPGFALRGQSVSPSQTHISVNGNRSDRYTLTVDWTLQATKTGNFSVGPPTIAVGTTRYSTRVVPLHVVPAGQAPPRRNPPPQQQPFPFPFQFSPFDPWRGMVQGPDVNQQPIEPAPPATDPKLALDAARGQLYFLHAAVDKTTAVVGEPIVFSAYEYIDSGASNLEVDEAEVHDADVVDFVKRPLLKDDDASLAGYASIGGRTWMVRLVRRWALFPLRTGDVTIGPMSVGLSRPRSVAGTKRTSETIHIQVSEPPAAGRPPGYAVGDVGRFTLSAQVQPRQAEQGGAVGVHVEVSGKGNVPNSIPVPSRPGVEWLAPQVHDKLGPMGRDAYGGTRSFDYVVRLSSTGDVSLGDLTLPFWDPDQGRYAVATAKLGTVKVTPSAAGNRSVAARSEPETLPGLPSPRSALEGLASAKRHLDDSLALWLGGAVAGPLSFVVLTGLAAVARRLGERWRQRRTSPVADLKERMSAAHAACASRDARSADAAIVRALEAATVAYTGVSVRGAIGGEIAERLERSGVRTEAAKSVADLLRECEAARFAPDAVDTAAAKSRWQRAQGAIRTLERRG